MTSSSPNRRRGSAFFLDGSDEGLTVVRYRLGQLEELGDQVLRSIELDPLLAGLRRSILGEIPDPAVSRGAAAGDVPFPGRRCERRRQTQMNLRAPGSSPTFRHSHVDVLNPRLFAFSDTARLIWSVAPFGKSALISTVILSSAWGSEARLLIISSASCTSRIFAVAGFTSTEP